MTTYWEECWRFSTARFTVVLEATPCQEDPAGQFDNEEDVRLIRDGMTDWFDCRVRVLLDGREVGSDYLGCCAYDSVREFYTTHIKYGGGYYFTDMVREAVREARKTLANLPALRKVA